MYYSQDSCNYDELYYDDVESLKLQADELEKVRRELEKGNKELENECLVFENQLKGKVESRKESEVGLAALNQYMDGLEKALSKAKNEILALRSHSDFEDSNRSQVPTNKLSKNRKEIEKPTPKPINYKPLTQRSLRNSREASLNGINN